MSFRASDIFPNLFQRQWGGKQCVRTDKGEGGFGCLIFQGFGLISVSSSLRLSLFSGDRTEEPQTLPKTGGQTYYTEDLEGAVC